MKTRRGMRMLLGQYNYLRKLTQKFNNFLKPDLFVKIVTQDLEIRYVIIAIGICKKHL